MHGEVVVVHAQLPEQRDGARLRELAGERDQLAERDCDVLLPTGWKVARESRGAVHLGAAACSRRAVDPAGGLRAVDRRQSHLLCRRLGRRRRRSAERQRRGCGQDERETPHYLLNDVSIRKRLVGNRRTPAPERDEARSRGLRRPPCPAAVSARLDAHEVEAAVDVHRDRLAVALRHVRLVRGVAVGIRLDADDGAAGNLSRWRSP